MNYKKIFSIIDKFVPKRNIWIFLCQPGDITNIIAIYEYILNNNLDKKNKIIPVWIGNYKEKKFILERFGNETLFYKRKSLKGLYYLLISRIAFITHGPILFLSSKRRRIINLWHGTALKNIGYLYKNDRKKYVADNHILYTTSQFDKLFFSAAWQMNPVKIKVTGSPRFDLLYHKEKQNENLKKILNFYNIHHKFKKIGFFLPTFKKWNLRNESINEGITRDENIFCFKNNDYDETEVINELKKNNTLILAKYHPFEENEILKKFSHFNSPPIVNIKNMDLADIGLTIYDIIGASDFLLTDYSGLALDYLLLNKPIFLIVPDLEKYKKLRGFIAEPYEFWLPGKILTEYSQFIKIVKNKFRLNKEEQASLELLKKIRMKYDDNYSSKRIFNDIIKY